MKTKRKSKENRSSNPHPPDHSIESAECGRCRIKFLEKKASGGDEPSATALLLIACEATTALERLLKAGSQPIQEIVEASVAWPILGNVDIKHTQRIPTRLGVSASHIPLSWKKLLTLNKGPHYIVYRLFEIIGRMRSLHHERESKKARHEVGPLPRNLKLAHITKLIDSGISIKAVAQVMTERVVAITHPPELVSKGCVAEIKLETELEQFISALDAPIPVNTRQVIEKFIPDAVQLPHPNANAVEAWFELGWNILLVITNNNPSASEGLRALAAKRENHKGNRSGKKESTAMGDVNYRIYERLQTPLATLKPGFVLRKNAKPEAA